MALKNPTEFLAEESHFFIDGAVGELELLTLCAKNPAKGVAIICHPHPLHLGTMNNKVVHTLSRAFHHRDIHAVRFNFRGVGKSQGQFGDSIGEIEDLDAVLGWVRQVLPVAHLYLAGFSFGAYIAAFGATKHPCQQLFSIAPSVNNQPYDALEKINCPWVVVQGEEDEVIPPQDVYAWFEKTQKTNQIRLFKIAGSSHFFHGKLIELRSLIEDNIIIPTL